MMLASLQRRGIFLLIIGVISGSVLSYLIVTHTQLAPLLSIGVLCLPFLLAVLTGAAKTTTA